MHPESNLDDVRQQALDKIEQSEGLYKSFIVIAAALEAIFLVLYLVLMDFSNTTHWLILIAAALVYGTITVGLFALGSYLDFGLKRLLQSIELLAESTPPEQE